MPHNLSSPSGIAAPIDLDDLAGWFERELVQISEGAESDLLCFAASHLEDFVSWPARAILLWRGCDRVPEIKGRQKYHTYPAPIKALAKKVGVSLDTRPNGPAIAALLIAGGARPPRFGSSNAWSIHHLYSGKFPYLGRDQTLHATKSGRHFTQSAGLVAVHPIADALSEEYPFYAWLLRAHAFLRYGYDPDGVLSSRQDDLGFAPRFSCEVLYEQARPPRPHVPAVPGGASGALTVRLAGEGIALDPDGGPLLWDGRPVELGWALEWVRELDAR